MVWAAFAAGGGTEITLVKNKMNLVFYLDRVLPDSLLPVTPPITLGDWTFQKINASDEYPVLYEILYEGEFGKDVSMAISECRLNLMEDLWGISTLDV
ncbi:hypothetical protein AVEN_93961-1 [Araneus ventricosus]|uniref:Uncharacterized protein n=1 Tax=Araneus ventricosus TaxID=182803 RepID=A0A4Y2CJL1_ARAVE|nr:hypothetical protein AVEN_93961-1 [Araneus ventricosus]